GKEEEIELPLEAPIPVQNRTQTIPSKNPNDEITEIFKRLNINDPALDTEKKQAANADEPTRIQPLRTDVPSFLKALD
ncbi:MAG TPA: cell division protein FtsZ, partial [Candidatus Cloacimonadota bacterium]|nr:cell division protein FtsZ [Candidatus Cloacimonadota bacterium]